MAIYTHTFQFSTDKVLPKYFSHQSLFHLVVEMLRLSGKKISMFDFIAHKPTKISNVKVYKKPLSSKEIASVYQKFTSSHN